MGCLKPSDVDLSGVTCPDAPVTDNDQELLYRHFAVDEEGDLVYFCDRHPERPADRPTCFGSDRTMEEPYWQGVEGGGGGGRLFEFFAGHSPKKEVEFIIKLHFYYYY